LHALTEAKLVMMDRRGRYSLAMPRETILEADVRRATLG
jgi:hypothetical protein